MFISLPMLKFYISARLFTFLMSNPLLDFLYFEHVIRTKNDFSASVLIVLGFDDVMSCISVLNIYIGKKNALSSFPKRDSQDKRTLESTGKKVVLGERVLQGCRANIND